MRFLLLHFVVVINNIFIANICGCAASNMAYNHGKRELNYAAAGYPATFNGRNFAGDYFQYQQQQQQQQNTIEDPGHTKQDENQTVQFASQINENALAQLNGMMGGNTSNMHNFVEFNNPPGQMFHLIYVPMNLNREAAESMQSAMDNAAKNVDYNKQAPAKLSQSLTYSGPQVFPGQQASGNGQTAHYNRQFQTHPQTQRQIQAHTQVITTTPAPSQYFGMNRPQASSYNNAFSHSALNAGFTPSPFPVASLYPNMARPAVQHQQNVASAMATKMEAPFIPSQFLGLAAPMFSTMRPNVDHSNLIKPIPTAAAHQAQLSGNGHSSGNMVYMPASNFYDSYRNVHRY